MSGHLPVMLAEVLEALAPRDGERYIDGTFGGGGYTRAILDAANCQVMGVDRDPAAIVRGEKLAAAYHGRLTMAHGPFSDMDSYAEESDFAPVDGVVLDLGVSSFQFDEADRGFSFRADGPLDMRMASEGMSAADVINHEDERKIAEILLRYGEERRARAIARAIVRARPITRTAELAELIAQVMGPKARAAAIHPATRSFQALRIYVNDELGELTRALDAATRVLVPGGRLVVVAFHSLEDRIVKKFLQKQSGAAPRASRHVPVLTPDVQYYRLLHRSPLAPGDTEVSQNPRARSAKLRAAVRLAVEGDM